MGRAETALSFLCLLVLLLLSGCGNRPPVTLGTAVPETARAVPVSALKTANKGAAASAAPVTLTGEMIEKCPVAGCWFRLRDRTGVIKVDTKEAGFVVTDVPVHATVTVSGTARRETGGEPYLAATGLRW